MDLKGRALVYQEHESGMFRAECCVSGKDSVEVVQIGWGGFEVLSDDVSLSDINIVVEGLTSNSSVTKESIGLSNMIEFKYDMGIAGKLAIWIIAGLAGMVILFLLVTQMCSVDSPRKSTDYKMAKTGDEEDNGIKSAPQKKQERP